MNCLINDIIKWANTKGTKVEVVRRYLRMRYRMNVELSALERRMSSNGINLA